MLETEVVDRLAIRDLADNWAVWRDSGDWDRLATLWADDSRMATTWSYTSGAEFVARSRAGALRGVNVVHMQGGQSIDIAGARAISQTKMIIAQRASVHDVLVDVFCTGRFYDFLEKRDGRWLIVLRQPIYERDRMDPVNPGDTVNLDAERLGSFPENYRYLAYLQTELGMTIQRDLPGLRGEEIDSLYRSGKTWLDGKQLDR